MATEARGRCDAHGGVEDSEEADCEKRGSLTRSRAAACPNRRYNVPVIGSGGLFVVRSGVDAESKTAF